MCSIKCFARLGNRYKGVGVYNFVPSARIERALPPSEGGILSVEIRGRMLLIYFIRYKHLCQTLIFSLTYYIICP